jgi:hypothetical protein
MAAGFKTEILINQLISSIMNHSHFGLLLLAGISLAFCPQALSQPLDGNRYNLQEEIDRALQTPDRTLKLPGGRLRVGKETIQIRDVEGLTIEGTGTTTIVFEAYVRGFSILNSSGITLRNFGIDYEPLPFTQGRITKVAGDHTSYEFEIHEGYPALEGVFADAHVQLAIIFDEHGSMKRMVPDNSSRKVTIIDKRKGRVTLNLDQFRSYELLKEGDQVAFLLRNDTDSFPENGDGSAVRADSGTRNFRVEDLRVYSAPGYAMCGRFLTGDNYFRFRVERGPTPDGASSRRLLSSCGDACNIGYCRKGPKIENCDFGFHGDDGVAMASAATPVGKVDNLTTIWTRYYSELKGVLKVGDQIALIGPSRMEFKGESEIESIETADKAPESFENGSSQGNRYFRLGLKTPLPNASPGDTIVYISLRGEGFLVRNNHIHDHRARGIRSTASGGIYEDNVIERSKQAGISILGSQDDLWKGAPENIIIRNNTIREVQFDEQQWRARSECPAAICLSHTSLEVPPKTGSYWLANVIIENNLIENVALSGIFLCGVKQAKIQNNKMVGTNLEKASESGIGTRWGFQGIDHAFAVNRSVAVTQSGNVFEKPGPWRKGNIFGLDP